MAHVARLGALTDELITVITGTSTSVSLEITLIVEHLIKVYRTLTLIAERAITISRLSRIGTTKS